MKKFLLSMMLLVFALPAEAAVVTRDIVYKDGDTELTGHFAYDDAAATPMPGVIVVHEWWGNNEYARRRARDLAALGYAAFAIDMYGTNRLATTPDQAMALSKPFRDDRGLMVRRAEAGLKTLLAQPQVDKERIGAIGYCFGGTTVLELARHGADLKGAVSFHGGLATPEAAEPGRVKAQVLALNGGDDKSVSEAEKQNFIKEMTAAGVTFKSIDYPGATHAFSNPEATEIGKKFNMPIAYDAAADAKSWEEMKKFFGLLFREKPAAP
jgi:dienelactone hydrolase